MKRILLAVIFAVSSILAQQGSRLGQPLPPMYTREDSVQQLTEWMQRSGDNPKDSTSGRVLSIYFTEQAHHRRKDPFSTPIHTIVLIKLLGDPYACVRAAAAEALSSLPSTNSSINAIRSLLLDGALGVRLKAAFALIHLGYSDSITSRIVVDVANGKNISHWSMKGFFPVVSPADTTAERMKIRRRQWQRSAIAHLRKVVPGFSEEAKETIIQLQTSSDTLLSSMANKEFHEFWAQRSIAGDKSAGAPK